jgi:hypothetical protein
MATLEPTLGPIPLDAPVGAWVLAAAVLRPVGEGIELIDLSTLRFMALEGD